jgi:hypothetical protein
MSYWSSHGRIDEYGHSRTRIIEPYSLRRTQAGHIVRHAVRADSGEHRSYRVDRIQNARTTEQIFIPRYAIKLAPSLKDWFGGRLSLEIREDALGLGEYGKTLTVLHEIDIPDEDDDDEEQLIESWTPRFASPNRCMLNSSLR